MPIYETERPRQFPQDNDWVIGILNRWGGNFTRQPNALPHKIELPPDDEVGCLEQVKILKNIDETLQGMTDAQVEFLAGIMVGVESIAKTHQAMLDLFRQRLPTKKERQELHKSQIEAIQRAAVQVSGRIALLDFHMTNHTPVEMEFDVVEPWDYTDDLEPTDQQLFAGAAQPPTIGGGGGGGGN